MKTALIVLLGVATAACSASNSPSAVPSATQSSIAADSKESTDFADIPGQLPLAPALTDAGQAEAPVGGCVNLSGLAVKAVLTVVDCGSMQNTYRIVQRVNIPKECGDADRPYYYNSTGTGQFTACLDLAWDSASCMSLGQPVTKVSCSDPSAPNKVKPIKVILNTTTVAGCPDGGYKHPLRRFTVCTQSQP